MTTPPDDKKRAVMKALLVMMIYAEEAAPFVVDASDESQAGCASWLERNGLVTIERGPEALSCFWALRVTDEATAMLSRMPPSMRAEMKGQSA